MPATVDVLTIAPAKTLLTPQQAANYLCVRAPTLANWRANGRGPSFVRYGRLIRYRLADLERWLSGRTIKPNRSRKGSHAR